VAPDLDEQALEDVVGLALDFRVAGIIATNTTTDLRLVQAPPGVEGGVSGAPLRARATATVRALYRLAAGKIPIVGVGGIFTAADAYEKIRAGASLVQLYTALIFTGPDLAWRLNEELLHLLERDGFRHLTEAVGCES
jgi:dihydroorotate dehydrogenase